MRSELFFQIKICYKLISKDKLLSTHVRELSFHMGMIPETLLEFESLLEQYIEEKRAYDQRLKEFEEQVSMSSPSKSPTRKTIFFSEFQEVYDFNCRPFVNSAVFPGHVSLRDSQLPDAARLHLPPLVTADHQLRQAVASPGQPRQGEEAPARQSRVSEQRSLS